MHYIGVEDDIFFGEVGLLYHERCANSSNQSTVTNNRPPNISFVSKTFLFLRENRSPVEAAAARLG